MLSQVRTVCRFCLFDQSRSQVKFIGLFAIALNIKQKNSRDISSANKTKCMVTKVSKYLNVKTVMAQTVVLAPT